MLLAKPENLLSLMAWFALTVLMASVCAPELDSQVKEVAHTMEGEALNEVDLQAPGA